MITIHTPTSVLNKSIAFYSNLKYELVNSTNPCLFKDGKTFIEINPDRYTRPGLKFYEKSWKQEVENLEQLTVVHVLSNGYLLNDSNGCWLYLIEQEFAYNYESKEKKELSPVILLALVSSLQMCQRLWHFGEY